MATDFSKVLKETAEKAAQLGSLKYFKSTKKPDTVNGVEIIYSVAPALKEKPAPTSTLADNKVEAPSSPWVKPDESLILVNDFEKDYFLTLNKFPVTEDHFLLVTKKLVPQNGIITEEDLDAAFKALKLANEATGKRYVGFYNLGVNSGASVPHRHFQFMPLPDRFRPFPDHVLATKHYDPSDEPLTDDRVLHHHAIIPTPRVLEPVELASAFATIMGDALSCLRDNDCREISYNLVFTEEWMLTTPRKLASVEDININALGTIGLLLAKSEDQLEYYQKTGPLETLEKVGFPQTMTKTDEGIIDQEKRIYKY